VCSGSEGACGNALAKAPAPVIRVKNVRQRSQALCASSWWSAGAARSSRQAPRGAPHAGAAHRPAAEGVPQPAAGPSLGRFPGAAGRRRAGGRGRPPAQGAHGASPMPSCILCDLLPACRVICALPSRCSPFQRARPGCAGGCTMSRIAPHCPDSATQACARATASHTHFHSVT